jgi:hypothetical protein
MLEVEKVPSWKPTIYVSQAVTKLMKAYNGEKNFKEKNYYSRI